MYYFLAQAEEMSTTDKWPGFVLTKEGEDFVQQNANLFKFDLLYNPMRFESWQRLANIYDEARFSFICHSEYCINYEESFFSLVINCEESWFGLFVNFPSYRLKFYFL